MNSRVVSDRICGPFIADRKQQRQVTDGGQLGEGVGVAGGERGPQPFAGMLAGQRE